MNAAAHRADDGVQGKEGERDFCPADNVINFGGQKNFEEGFHGRVPFFGGYNLISSFSLDTAVIR
jgi:hypothetical protein